MTEYTAVPKPEQQTGPTPDDEDSGRLTHASRGRLIAILVMLVLFTEVVPLQIGMVAMILPQIGRAFPASGDSTTWAISILGVAGGATMALVGKAADLYGKKRLLLVCGGLAVLGTLLCALTSDWAVFLTGRGIASVSWGMAVVNYGIVRDLFPRRWIPIAVGFIGTGLGLASIIGPLVCGALTVHLGWRSVFWFLAIYLVVMMPLVALFVPESRVRVRQRFDVVGAVLFGVGVGVTLIYLSQGTAWGWTSLKCLAFLVGGIVALGAFVLWERRVPDPMMELSLLRAPKVLLVMVAAFFFTGVQSMLAILTTYLFETPAADRLHQEILEGVAAKTNAPVSAVERFVRFEGDISYAGGYSVLTLALRIFIWWAVFMMIFGPVGGYLARRAGARVPMIISTVSLLAACALWINWHSTWQEQVSIGLLMGLGSGFFFAAWPNLIMDSVPASRQGVTTGMVQVFNGVGTSVSTALLASVLAAHPLRMIITPPGAAPVTSTVPQVYTDSGFSQAYLLLGVVPCAITVVIALVLRSGRTPARGGEPLA
jgi:MFS family permease